MATLSWYEPGDYFHQGKEFWLQSRCLAAIVSQRSRRLHPTEAAWAATAYANALRELLVVRLSAPWEVQHLPAGSLRDSWRDAKLVSLEWIAGHLAYGVVRGLPPYDGSFDAVERTANCVLKYAEALASKLELDLVAPVFPENEAVYGIPSKGRRTVAIMATMLNGVPHDIVDPKIISADALARARAVEPVLGIASQHNWLVKRCIPWMISQIRIGSPDPVDLVHYLVEISEALAESPDLDTAEQEWQAQHILLGIINSLHEELSPVHAVRRAITCTASLVEANDQLDYPMGRDAHDWLSAEIMAQLMLSTEVDCFLDDMQYYAKFAATQAQTFADHVQSKRLLITSDSD